MGNEMVVDDTVTFKVQRYSNFVPSNPKSDRFKVKGYHHIEFWCGDATNTSLRFSYGLGMPLVAKSDITTGNVVHASYLLGSRDVNFLFTASYSQSRSSSNATAAMPTFDYHTHASFVTKHGLGIRAVALEVEDAKAAFDISIAAGGHVVSEPVLLDGGQIVMSEVKLCGDVVLRYVSHATSAPSCCFLPKFVPVEVPSGGDYHCDFGFTKLDHAGGAVPDLVPAVEYLKKITGFHEFTVLAAEDFLEFGETAVQSVFLANNDESLIINLTEPVLGTKQNSYIKTFLDYNEGPGVQHVAIATNDIFKTVREMKKRSSFGGFNFMPSSPPEYYKDLRKSVGNFITEEQMQECEELGIRLDMNEDGVLLQTLSTPVGDRPTLILEILQRVGCMVEGEDGKMYQKGGCGGFGKGNIQRLVKSIEDYEKITLAPSIIGHA